MLKKTLFSPVLLIAGIIFIFTFAGCDNGSSNVDGPLSGKYIADGSEGGVFLTFSGSRVKFTIFGDWFLEAAYSVFDNSLTFSPPVVENKSHPHYNYLDSSGIFGYDDEDEEVDDEPWTIINDNTLFDPSGGYWRK